MKRILLLGICLFVGTTLLQAQKKTALPVKITAGKPKLVVGLVVDQMRWDYLYRYQGRYGANGFNRLLKQGFTCENTFLPYTPTYTAVGHACVYTGSVPALNGIVGNNWYNRHTKQMVYCTDDNTVTTVGSNSDAGKMSPENLWSNTITDQLRLSTHFKSKVIGIALKDRGAILPAGHSANAAYWFDDATGGWISSSYYMKELPKWLVDFNSQKYPEQYLAQDWKTLYPIETYMLSTADDSKYESAVPGEDNQFPHLTANLTKTKYSAFKLMPQANSYTLNMARAALEAENLGQDSITDFLAVSLSTPDYMGHSFGPNSVEAEDSYLRLDQQIAEFLLYLDQKVGKDAYTFFITADHGVAHIPGFLQEHQIPGGTVSDDLAKELNHEIELKFNVKNAVEKVTNMQIFLSELEEEVEIDDLKVWLIAYLLKKTYIANVVDLGELAETSLPAKVKWRLTNGYNQKLSGDLQYLLKPNWFEGGKTGTTHGAWNPYDSHIPFVLFGWGIKQGKTNRETYMSDIAPTLAALLRIEMPNACVGDAIQEAIR